MAKTLNLGFVQMATAGNMFGNSSEHLSCDCVSCNCDCWCDYDKGN